MFELGEDAHRMGLCAVGIYTCEEVHDGRWMIHFV